MVFNSYTFIVFFAIMLVLHNLLISWKAKKVNLLIASYIFYAAWNPPFILLLWLSTVVDFFVGKALYTQANKHKRRLLLVISLIGNLGMLFFQIWWFYPGEFCAHYQSVRYRLSSGQTEYHSAGRYFLLYFHYALLHDRHV